MNDPLKDPRFPDRPSHPDFWQLAQLTMRRDGAATEGQTLPEAVDGIVDMESLYYMAKQRCMRAMPGAGSEQIARAMGAYFDAFLLGYEYANVKNAQK